MHATELSASFPILIEKSKTLETTFLNAGSPKRLISHTVNNFLQDPPEDDNLIPGFLFEERKKIFIKLPYWQRNEKLSKTFISKLNNFTGSKYILSSSGKQDKSKVFSTLRTKTLTDHMWSTKATVLAVLITLGKPGKMWRCESMNIQTPLMTLNLPVTYARIDPFFLLANTLYGLIFSQTQNH